MTIMFFSVFNSVNLKKHKEMRNRLHLIINLLNILHSIRIMDACITQ
jgi:hypothetical protein